SIENALQPAHMLTTSGRRKPPSRGRLPSWLVHGKVVFASQIGNIGVQERRVAVDSRPRRLLVRCNVVIRVHPGRRVGDTPAKQAVVPAEYDLAVSKQHPSLLHRRRQGFGTLRHFEQDPATVLVLSGESPE